VEWIQGFQVSRTHENASRLWYVDDTIDFLVH